MVKQYYKLEGYNATSSIGYLLKNCSKNISQRIENLFLEEEVSFVQWVVMMHLRDGIATTAAELSQNICHDSGALTRVLDQLEKRELVERKRSLKDRRIVELKLTPTGYETCTSFLPRIIDMYNTLLEDFTKEEVDTLINLLSRIKSKLTEDTGIKEN